MSAADDELRVLVVDDEREVADMLTLQLELEYEVETAYGGEQALAALDQDVDVVLLDRRMPTLSGDELLATIREEGPDCRVIMVSAVAPDYDVLDMAFDDYVTKPVDPGGLVDAVDLQAETLDDEQLRALVRAIAKRRILEATKSEPELDANEGVQRLRERERRLREQVGTDDEWAERVADVDRI